MPGKQNKKYIYLIGYESDEIAGVKLPTNEQVLSFFFFKLRTIKLSVSQSALDTVKEVEAFWNRAKIPMNCRENCVRKLKAIYKEWYNLSKSRKRKSVTQANNEKKFKCKLKETFSTGFPNNSALTEDQKLFVQSQRQPTRRGFIDRSLNNEKKIDCLINQEEENLSETNTEGK